MGKRKNVAKKGISKKLKLLMESKGFTQEKVAKDVGVSQPTIVNWLQGAMPNGANLTQLAEANGVTTGFFLDINPQERPNDQAAKLNLGIENEFKKPIDNVSERVNIERVNPLLPNLIERLKKATQERGKKSALADFLDVPLARVSQWLSGDREPGGETTLKLLHWVEAQERQ